MLIEADLFVRAEDMLVEVVGRVQPEDREIVLPAMHPGAAAPTTVRQAVDRHLSDDRQVPRVLGGAPSSASEDAEIAEVAAVAEVARLACAAAREVADGDALVRTGEGELPAQDYLLRATLARSLFAHYLAAYLGSTACPLPEELARPLWELTAPEADRWRALGWFRDPMPLPDHVSWRDRFLLDAGHLPHPLGH